MDSTHVCRHHGQQLPSRTTGNHMTDDPPGYASRGLWGPTGCRGNVAMRPPAASERALCSPNDQAATGKATGAVRRLTTCRDPDP